MTTPQGSEPAELTIDDVIFDIEDYVGGNIEGIEHVDHMGFTVFLRRKLEDLVARQTTAAYKQGQEYRIAQDLKRYMSRNEADTVGMVTGFANILISVLCIDTNATDAELKMSDLSIREKPVGTWKVTIKQITPPEEPSK